jgi:hypothetical protein
MTQFASEEMPAFNPEELAFAESELKVALIFADLYSRAYAVGRLKRASDARSKAKSLCGKAATRLSRLKNGQRAQSMLTEVVDKVDKLANLPQLHFRARTAG